jgi:hypothetical protein
MSSNSTLAVLRRAAGRDADVAPDRARRTLTRFGATTGGGGGAALTVSC